MTLQECYAAMGGDYNDAIGRLRSERLVQKFVLKFAEDGSYSLLQSSLADSNYDEAFRAAHTIKGVCQNLSLTRLADSSSALCESLRGGTPPASGLAEQVSADYQETVSAIQAFREGISG
ncbi:MAG: Hpt domain-containing protein [Oscillibacter sp.]|jgi:HPt (histidine-containing phosphotransfer) domain-containing protein|nr:Hpt domain-containing protein [Oscillibacter sp.]